MEPPSTGRVSVINQSGRKLPASRIQQAAERALGDAQGAVCILLTDDAEVRRLNKTFRGIDETTDVLSFCAISLPQPPPSLTNQSEGGGYEVLGDIAISVPYAERQAAERRVSI